MPTDERWEALPECTVNAADRAVAGRTKRRSEWRVAEDLACRERQLRESLSTLSATQRELEEAKGLRDRTLSVNDALLTRVEVAETNYDNLKSELSTTHRERDELKEQERVLLERVELLTGEANRACDLGLEATSRLKTAEARVAELEKALKERSNDDWIPIAIIPEYGEYMAWNGKALGTSYYTLHHGWVGQIFCVTHYRKLPAPPSK